MRHPPTVEALLLAALAASCSGNAESIDASDFAECNPSPLLDQLSTREAYDGLELRTGCETYVSSTEPPPPATFSATEVFGTSCTSDGCAARIAELDAQMAARIQPASSPAASCLRYLVAMRGDAVIVSASSAAELTPILGAIDTADEVSLMTSFAGIGCSGVREVSDGYDVLTSVMTQDCPIVTHDVVYHLASDGTLTLVREGPDETSNSCIGRRPEGLVPARRAACDGLGDYFARAAELEAASIVAFHVLRHELAHHGAPGQLLSRIARALADEVRHARATRRLAQRYGSAPVDRAIQAGPVRDLEAIAHDNVREGCVFETWGALVGLWQARTAADPVVRGTLRSVATDELRHAQLSWDIAHWLDSRLDAAARDRVARERTTAATELRTAIDAPAPRFARTAGLPSKRQKQRLWSEIAPRLWPQA